MNSVTQPLALVTAIVLLAGCATKVEQIHIDPAFTHSALVAGKLGIAAIVARGGSLSEQDRSVFGEMLRAAIESERKRLKVSGPGETANLLGAEKYEQLLSFYTKSAMLDSQWLAELKEYIKNKKYLLFAIITQDEISRTSHTRTDEIRDAKGKVVKSKNYLVRETSRVLHVITSIYDLTTGQFPWSSSISSEESNKFENLIVPEQEQKNPDFKEVVMDILMATSETSTGAETFPQPPSRFELLKNIFLAIGENLPRSCEDLSLIEMIQKKLGKLQCG